VTSQNEFRFDDTSVTVPDGTDALRNAWRDLVGHRMPAAAQDRGWPIRFDHCFARVLLDNACGRPWREAITPPAWRNASPELLTKAIALGEACLTGKQDLTALNRRSLELRGKLSQTVADDR